MNLKTIALALSLGLATQVASGDNFDKNSRQEIESIVDEYVSNHPEVIVRALKKLEQNEQRIHEENISNISSQIRNDNSVPSKGNAKAKHYIIEFFDFGCGYCKVMEPFFDRAAKEFDLQIAYVNIPVIKEASKQLAIYGQAIYNLNQDAYFKFHSHFMKPGTHATDLEAIKLLVKDELKLDFEDVVNELKSMEPQKQIGRYLNYSMQLKVAGTPYLIIDGKEIRGAITDYETLKDLLSDK
ncbi:MAG: thioredoxin domain-containing protein [Succinivibrio sp.]